MGICVSSHVKGGVETAPVPSVNDLQKQLGVSREEAYQQKLDLQSPNFVKRFSESGMSLASKGSMPRTGSATPSPSHTIGSFDREVQSRSLSFDANANQHVKLSDRPSGKFVRNRSRSQKSASSDGESLRKAAYAPPARRDSRPLAPPPDPETI
jgi:DNA-binding GntR family transcriptional regulator